MITGSYLKWLNQEIEKTEKNNGLYKFMCIFLGKRRLTYKDMYLLLQRLGERKLGLDKAKINAFEQIIEIYKYNNGEIPYKLENNDANQ